MQIVSKRNFYFETEGVRSSSNQSLHIIRKMHHDIFGHVYDLNSNTYHVYFTVVVTCDHTSLNHVAQPTSLMHMKYKATPPPLLTMVQIDP